MTPIAKLIAGLGHSHSTWQVFSDFVELSALSISNAVDLNQREKREARYLHAVKRYKPAELSAFPQMLGELVAALEEKPRDVLGALYGELELANKWAGQFFTPQDVADMMARMTFDASLAPIIEERGFITVCEPAVGGGAMVIAACKAFNELGFNYQRQMHVSATDVDERAVHMAYVQLSLLSVPAVVIHGNTITQERYGAWYTPAHILGFWSSKLQRAPTAPALVTPQRELIFA